MVVRFCTILIYTYICSSDHRVIPSGSGLQGSCSLTYCSGPMESDWVAEGCVRLSPKHLQGWTSQNPSGQPVSVFGCCHDEKFFLLSNWNFPCFSLIWLLLCMYIYMYACVCIHISINTHSLL